MSICMMKVNEKTLLNFCDSNHFTDSEDDNSEEEHDEPEGKKKNVISEQPTNEKITIIVDSSNVIQCEDSEDICEWEKSEFADSFSNVVKEKTL